MPDNVTVKTALVADGSEVEGPEVKVTLKGGNWGQPLNPPVLGVNPPVLGFTPPVLGIIRGNPLAPPEPDLLTDTFERGREIGNGEGWTEACDLLDQMQETARQALAYKKAWKYLMGFDDVQRVLANQQPGHPSACTCRGCAIFKTNVRLAKGDFNDSK